MNSRSWKTLLVIAVASAAIAAPAFAAGGRGGGGGGRGGGGRGGGGGRAGGMARPGGGGGGSFNRTPSFNARPGGNAQPQRAQRPAGNTGARPSNPQPNFNQANRNINQGNRNPNVNQANRNPNVNAGNRVGNPNINAGNRTQINNQANTVNRANIGNNVNAGNRVNQNTFNRTTNQNVTVNNVGSGNRNVGNYGRPNGGYGGYHNAYNGYHSNWVNGSWNHHYNGWGNNAAWFGAGLGVGALGGWGLASWAYSPSVYNWGYASYANPYYVVQQPVVIQQPVVNVAQPIGGAPVYDYAQPINTEAPPPEQSTADAAVATFDQARAAFQAGDYTTALALTDQALAKMPGDPAMHEFRGLCLFAMGQYDQAASVLYGVLSAGPGWDWTTLVSLYPEVSVYTGQLRKLEAYCRANPTSASARFVLGYQYLTEGFPDTAAREFAAVAKLKPSDKLSSQLAAQLGKPAAEAPAEAPAAPAEPQPEPAPSPVPAGATIAGSWTASPAQGVTISLNLKPDNSFAWSVKAPGQTTNLAGTSAYDGGILTLNAKDGQPLVGRVTWKDATHMTFQVVGAPPDDPGLSFAK